jgi:hypothetical protein
MTRRNFFKALTAAIGGLVILGIAYRRFNPSDSLSSFRKSTRKVLSSRFGKNKATRLMTDIQREYAHLTPTVPDIGGKENLFTEWLNYGVYYLAVYQVLKRAGYSLDQTGEIIYRTYETMADYPKWFLKMVGKIKYGSGYVDRLKQAAESSLSQSRPGGWVCRFIEGDGHSFDWGLDITKCGIVSFYKAHQAEELAPYMCLSDFVVSKAFDRGLVRLHTLAEGADHCDFRYKEGRDTFVSPLKKGWPPQFLRL